MIFPLNRIRSAPACCACTTAKPDNPRTAAAKPTFSSRSSSPSNPPNDSRLYVREGQLTQPDVHGATWHLPRLLACLTATLRLGVTIRYTG